MRLAERLRRVPRRDLWLAGAVLLAAAGLRLWDLGLKPMHHDEGVNGFFLQGLVRDGSWRYDPTNYHGPTLYYLSAAITAVTGLTTSGVRLTTVLAGLATVLLVMVGFRRSLGAGAALAGAALLAVSPGAVYFSRYFIHETLVLLFTALPVVAGLRYAETGARRALVTAACGLALLFATKETAILHAVVVGAAWLAAGWLTRGRDAFRASLPWPDRRSAAIAVGTFAAIHVTLFSSFFTNLQGIPDSVRALVASSQTGTSAHVNAWSQHLRWLVEGDRAALVAGAGGALLALWDRRSRVAVFVTLWASGLLAAYSAVPYKTPWLGLNVVLPLCIVGGWALVRLAGMRPLGTLLAVVAASTALGWSAWEAASLNFVRYDDEGHAYVYAHTRRGFVAMVDEIRALAEASGRGTQMPITIASPEHWPLPWYLRDYPGAGFYGEIPQRIDGMVVVGRLDQDAALARALGPTFTRVGQYPLRPGVELVLYARWDLLARRILPPPDPASD